MSTRILLSILFAIGLLACGQDANDMPGLAGTGGAAAQNAGSTGGAGVGGASGAGVSTGVGTWPFTGVGTEPRKTGTVSTPSLSLTVEWA